jgi:hypothetical protein
VEVLGIGFGGWMGHLRRRTLGRLSLRGCLVRYVIGGDSEVNMGDIEAYI